MAVRYRKLQDLDQFSEGMSKLKDGWTDVRQALYLAMSHETMNDIGDRTPESTRQRYPERIDAGNANLRKSIKLRVESNQGDRVKVWIGSEGVEYAARVHDMQDPHPNGRPVRWTKQGSGNKFIGKPLHDNRDLIPADMMDEIDARIERQGL